MANPHFVISSIRDLAKKRNRERAKAVMLLLSRAVAYALHSAVQTEPPPDFSFRLLGLDFCYWMTLVLGDSEVWLPPCTIDLALDCPFPTASMRRDAIFYQLFQRFPSLFFTLLDRPPEQARGYRFESVEVKEPTFRIDGVFLPPESASPRILFFTEVQFQKDESLYHRFFSESLLYLYRNQSRYDDWYGVVIFPSRSLEPENTQIHRSLLNGPQVQRLYLDELGAPNQQPVGISLIQLMMVVIWK